MAEKRMFAKQIVLSDAFLDMPMSARCLYFTLGMFGDDDGFVNSPKGIMRQIGASMDDMNILIAKKFVIVFESGVIVIKHWRVNNYLRNDRYKETKYKDEKNLLTVGEDGIYHKVAGIPTVDQCDTSGIPNITEHSIAEHSITKQNREEAEERFDVFWDKYPRKTDKKKAKAVFLRINPNEELFNTMLSALDEQIKSDQWERGFIPYPTTWLNGERWNDAVSKAPQASPTKKYGDYLQREPVKNDRFGLDYLLEDEED